ncbi:MAG: hypothetical protein EXR45_00495 [Chloroflexi bacterium]|nr:hypothetical protein [Chloroflexota bacterium]
MVPVSTANRRRLLLATVMTGSVLRFGNALADDGSGPTGTDGPTSHHAGPLIEVFAARLGEGAVRDLHAFDTSPEPVPVTHGWFHPVFGPNSGYAVVDEPSGPALASAHSRY